MSAAAKHCGECLDDWGDAECRGHDDQPCPLCGSSNLTPNLWSLESGEVDALECNACLCGAPREQWNAHKRLPDEVIFLTPAGRQALGEDVVEDQIQALKRLIEHLDEAEAVYMGQRLAELAAELTETADA